MSKATYSDKRVIYESSETNVKLYRATGPEGVQVVIKEQVHASIASVNAAVGEAINQAKIFHPFVVRVFACQLEETEGGRLKTSIIEEAMERDLEKEIEERRQQNRRWTEAELERMFTNLASALAYSERVGVSHRDVKPQNIYLSGGDVKLGDFGSSAARIFSKIQKTLQGTPFYLSPELKEFYIQFLRDPATVYQYDASKSDVYSLGVTFLYMIALQPPAEMMQLNGLASTTSAIVQRLPVSDRMKSIISRMLVISPASRVTFQELEHLLQSPQSDSLPLPARLQPQPAVHVAEERKLEEVAGNLGKLGLSSPEAVPDPPETRAHRKVKKCLCDPAHQVKDWELTDPELTKTCDKVTDLFCSEQCLRNFSVVCKWETCVQCNNRMLGDKQFQRLRRGLVMLPCTHFFHGMKCLKDFLLDKTANFTRKSPIACPKCRQFIDPSKVEEYFTPRKLANFVKETLKCVCRRCGRTADLTSPSDRCQHKYCSSCLSECRQTCQFCDFVPPS